MFSQGLEFSFLCGALVARQASSDLTSLGETESSDEDDPARGALLWRHVRMIVRGVRGMRGVPGGGSRLEGTVAYRAARWGNGRNQAEHASSHIHEACSAGPLKINTRFGQGSVPCRGFIG